MAQTHSRPIENGRAVYYTERLWQLARELPVETVLIADIPEFEQNCWFRPHTPPTVRAVAEHAKRIAQADLSYPIILSADGRLMDGGHRICKAWMLGQTAISAVRFVIDPEPDYVITEP